MNGQPRYVHAWMLCLMTLVFIAGGSAVALATRLPGWELLFLLGGLVLLNVSSAVGVWLVDRDR